MYGFSLSIDQAHAATNMVFWVTAGITTAFVIDRWFCRRGRRRRRPVPRR